jgi:Holliday junction resolvasome RuvABC endonuclease subunit
MIAGFDPSLTHFGWVCFDENKSGPESVLQGGVFKTDPSDGLLVQRLLMQQERVSLFLSSRNIKFVSMEAPVWGDYNSEMLFALNQFLHMVFMDLGIYVIQFPPTTLKKYAYPDMDPDNVTKHYMTDKAKKELGRQGRRFSEHVADAYFAGKLGLKFYKWLFMHEFSDSDLSEHERDLFCGKHTFTRGLKKGTTEYNGTIYKENEKFWDYTKTLKTSETIKKDVQNGREETYSGRIF